MTEKSSTFPAQGLSYAVSYSAPSLSMMLISPSAATGEATKEPIELRPVSAATSPSSSALPPADASTDDRSAPIALETELQLLFHDAKEEIFEDGMESQFSQDLTALILQHGELAIKALSGFIGNKAYSVEVAAEALRWIGHLHDPRTFRYRLWLLGNSLNSRSFRIRDGALLGLSFMDSTKAIRPLEKALLDEKSPELRTDIEALLVELKARLVSGKAP